MSKNTGVKNLTILDFYTFWSCSYCIQCWLLTICVLQYEHFALDNYWNLQLAKTRFKGTNNELYLTSQNVSWFKIYCGWKSLGYRHLSFHINKRLNSNSTQKEELKIRTCTNQITSSSRSWNVEITISKLYPDCNYGSIIRCKQMSVRRQMQKIGAS